MDEYVPVIQTLQYPGHGIDVLRLDLVHPLYGGNKYFKLKYNYLKAKELGYSTVLTFGGAHSNHIYSTAAFCKEKGIKVIGVIRGEKEMLDQSPVLQFAIEQGMELYFVSREEYKYKADEKFINKLCDRFGDFYPVPEGGNNYEGVKGCTEILTEDLKKYDYVFCACGTSATFSGIKISSRPEQCVVGISVLKGENTLIGEANKWLGKFDSNPITQFSGEELNQSTILDIYHFGGYAKHTEELLDFKVQFESRYGFQLDYVYTAKVFAAAFDLAETGILKENVSVLIVHTGGYHANPGYEKRYQLKPIL